VDALFRRIPMGGTLPMAVPAAHARDAAAALG
jgi:hypothetical protein